ncbi:MAG: hypothetical protein GY799_18920 [Desulfobulbaceae bacterium]|nr:hypothetical protein [Desulfobulbaceae bacterium]
MAQTKPTPLTLEDLINVAADINLFNDGVKTQEASPRNLGTQRITVQVVDDPLAVKKVSSTTDGTTAGKVVDSTADFVTAEVAIGDAVYNTTDDTWALVTAVDSATVLSVDNDVFITAEDYYVIPATYWTQRFGLGEWRQSGSRSGNDKSVSYTLPVNTATVLVHEIVYPIALAAIGTYPPITSAETP